jgi:two-component system response regulator AtoC
MSNVLIVDEDGVSSNLLREAARDEGLSSLVVTSIKQASIQITLQRPDVLFTAQNLTDGSGLSLIDVSGTSSRTIVIMMMAEPSVDAVIDAWRLGVTDYLTKPLDLHRVRRWLRDLSRTVQDTRRQASSPCLLGTSVPMKILSEHISRVAPTEATVLLLGESGTGKELVAQTIHAQSTRHRQPFIPINCGAISPQLIESEIFGHEKGSFTGADRQHKGYFERACGGTLFLDEVLEMPVELQVKLLRVLETGAFLRIGSHQTLRTNVRIIAASNRDPERSIAEGRLRLDLFHRLNVFPLRIPPLRDRKQDIELLARHFLDALNTAHGTAKMLPESAMHVLRTHQWPGNVRELRNFIHRAYILSDQIIDTQTIAPVHVACRTSALTLSIPVGTSLAEVDRKLIFATMELCGGVKKRVADLLGISLKTLYNRLEEYGRQDQNLMTFNTPAHGMSALTKRSEPMKISSGISFPM